MFFSIVIPVFNAQDYIERAIKSIQNQSFQDYEVICIDDGSQDNSPDILDRISEKDNRIQVIHCKNGGVSKARNRGIDLAKGEYLLFMDADDRYEEEALSLLYDKLLVDNPEFLCFGYREIVYKENQPVKETEKNYRSRRYTKADIQKGGLDIISHPLFGSVWSKAYKRELLQKKKLRMDENLYVGEDYCFNLEVLRNTEDFYTIENPFYIYMIQNDQSIINRYKKDKFEQMYRMHQIRTAFIKEYLKEQDVKKAAFIRYNFVRLCMSCFMDYFRKECTLTKKEQKQDIRERLGIENEPFYGKYMEYYSMPQKIIYSLFSTKNSALIRGVAKACYILKFKLGKEV